MVVFRRRRARRPAARRCRSNLRAHLLHRARHVDRRGGDAEDAWPAWRPGRSASPRSTVAMGAVTLGTRGLSQARARLGHADRRCSAACRAGSRRCMVLAAEQGARPARDRDRADDAGRHPRGRACRPGSALFGLAGAGARCRPARSRSRRAVGARHHGRPVGRGARWSLLGSAFPGGLIFGADGGVRHPARRRSRPRRVPAVVRQHRHGGARLGRRLALHRHAVPADAAAISARRSARSSSRSRSRRRSRWP